VGKKHCNATSWCACVVLENTALEIKMAASWEYDGIARPNKELTWTRVHYLWGNISHAF
jgi:hypothetical protein